MENLDEEYAFREQINEALAASSASSSRWGSEDTEFLMALRFQEMLENEFLAPKTEWQDAQQDFDEVKTFTEEFDEQTGPSEKQEWSDIEEFDSCYEEEEEWRDTEENCDEEFSESSCILNDHRESQDVFEPKPKGPHLERFFKMFFKGMSEIRSGELGLSSSGIGVVIQNPYGDILKKVQKKLEFYVDGTVAEHLALMDGLLAALELRVPRVQAFTDSELVYDQIARGHKLDNQLLIAVRQRILEHVRKLDNFVLTFLPSHDIKKALFLAKEAIDMPSASKRVNLGDGSGTEDCLICCENKAPWEMVTVKCFHRFCSHCMGRYVDSKLQACHVPIRCPQMGCEHYISAEECKAFLPADSYESLLKTLAEANIPDSKKVYCPFPNCSALLDKGHDSSARASTSSHPEVTTIGCVECPECRRLFCADCCVPWHSSISCEEYQSLPADERESEDVTLHRLAQNKRWRRCQECRRMIELTQGCFHMTCWCGHEFCYACGAEYRNKQQTCQCAYWDEQNIVNHPVIDDASSWTLSNGFSDNYLDHEESQMALLDRFLAEGFLPSNPLRVPRRPHFLEESVDSAIREVPWLRNIVSAISGSSYEQFL
eukprot:Gb_23736 [translate_table: standard]